MKKIVVCFAATMLLFLSACENFVVPALQRPVSKSNAYLTELVAQWTDDSSADPSFGAEYNGGSFTATLHKGKNEERFSLYGFDENVHLVRLTLTVNDPSEEITYETVDRVLHDRSGQMSVYVNPFSGMGVIELNMLYRFDTDIYIFVGKHAYTICIQKMTRNQRIYVSKYGDGSGSMDDTTGGDLRGYTPDSAFFSLKNAIERGKLSERYDIYIVGELDNDPAVPDGDAIFVIANTGEHRFRIWDGGGGSLKSPLNSNKRVMNIQNADVAFIDLDISGGNGVNYGGAAFIDASQAAFLRCDITDNAAGRAGGAVYVADKVTGRASSAVTFNSTTMQDNARPRPEPFDSAAEGIWAGIYSKLTFENAAIHDDVYFNGEPEVGSFVVGGSTYFGKGTSITLDDIIAGNYGAQIRLPNENAKITLAGNVPAGMDTHGLAAFIDTPAPAGKQVLVRAAGSAAPVSDVYNRFRINNNMPLSGRIASLRGIGADGKVMASSQVHVRSDGNDFCDGLTEGSGFKSFEYAVFLANRFTAPHVRVKDMLNNANHRELPAAVGWAASDTSSIFSIGIPQAQSDRTIVIEGKDPLTPGTSGINIGLNSVKRGLFIGAYSDVMLKNLKLEGITTTAMPLASGSAISVASDARLTLDTSVSGGGLGLLNAGTLTVAAGGSASFDKVTSTRTVTIAATGTLSSPLLVSGGTVALAGTLYGRLTYSISGATTMSGNISYDGVEVTSGTFTADGNITGDSKVSGGTFNLKKTLTGALAVSGGTFTLAADAARVSGGNITLTNSSKVNIASDVGLTNSMIIAPYSTSDGTQVLTGNVTVANVGKFSLINNTNFHLRSVNDGNLGKVYRLWRAWDSKDGGIVWKNNGTVYVARDRNGNDNRSSAEAIGSAPAGWHLATLPNLVEINNVLGTAMLVYGRGYWFSGLPSGGIPGINIFAVVSGTTGYIHSTDRTYAYIITSGEQYIIDVTTFTQM